MGDPSPLDTIKRTSQAFINAYDSNDTTTMKSASAEGMGALRELVLSHRRKIDDGKVTAVRRFGKMHATTNQDIRRKAAALTKSAAHPYRNEQRTLSTRDIANAIAHADKDASGFRVDASSKHVLVLGVPSKRNDDDAWIAEFEVAALCEAIESELYPD